MALRRDIIPPRRWRWMATGVALAIAIGIMAIFKHVVAGLVAFVVAAILANVAIVAIHDLRKKD